MVRWCLWASPAAGHLCLGWRAAHGPAAPGILLDATLLVPGCASTAPGLSAPSPGCPAATSGLFTAHMLFLLTAWGLAEDPQRFCSRQGPLSPSGARD